MSRIPGTERLRLREFTEDDAGAFYRLNTDPDVIRHTGDPFPITSVDHARTVLRENPIADYRKHGFGRWACILKSTGDLIGFAGLKFLEDLEEVDLGYRFLPEHWGVGLATEVSRAVVAFGFDTLDLDTIIGLVHPDNHASVRVLEKLEFRSAGTIDTMGIAALRYTLQRMQT